MKRTLLDEAPKSLPREIRDLIAGSKIYDSSCSPEARVYFADKGDGYFIKSSAAGTLKKEALMAGYFHNKGFGAEVVYYGADGERDWLMTVRAAGEDLIDPRYLADPKRLSETLGSELRKLHETDFSDCPVQNRTRDYLSLAKENYLSGNYDKSAFPDSFGYASANEAYRVLTEGESLFKNDTLIHGDYCLPNVMLDNWSFSAFIDLGGAGVGDRHIDLFWGAWSLWFNLKTNAYRDRFLDSYGRDKINLDMLRIVAAAEVFG